MTFFSKIGPLDVKFNGDSEIISQIIKELGSIKNSENHYDIELNIDPEKNLDFNPTHYSGGKSLNFDSTSFFSASEWYDYVLENGFNDNITKIHIFLKQQNFVQTLKLKRLTLKNIELSDVKSIIRNSILSYSFFWYAIHLTLLKKNSSFIHAAIIEKENSGTVLCGTGGAGKTSLCFELLKDSKVNYLSEDFGIIDSEGNSYFNPKAISLYKSDISHGNPIIKKALKILSSTNKMKWNILTSVMSQDQLLKIPPASLFSDDRICQKTKINHVAFLIREKCESIHSEEISINEFSERASRVAMREFKNIVEIINLITADSPDNYDFVPMIELFNQTKQVYIDAFDKITPILIHIPIDETPSNVADFLRDKQII